MAYLNEEFKLRTKLHKLNIKKEELCFWIMVGNIQKRKQNLYLC